MQVYPSLAHVENFELACGVFALDCSCFNLLELGGGSREVDVRNTRPESTDNDTLQQVCIGTVGIQGRGGGRG
jgi:hypothetical protein